MPAATRRIAAPAGTAAAIALVIVTAASYYDLSFGCEAASDAAGARVRTRRTRLSDGVRVATHVASAPYTCAGRHRRSAGHDALVFRDGRGSLHHAGVRADRSVTRVA